MFAQTDSAAQKINDWDIELVYSHYMQNGEHSAVTAGIGTEKLRVYAPGLNIKRTKNSNAFWLNAGVDVVSSASTDKIDDVVSSASILDNRIHADLGFEHHFASKDLRLGASFGSSIESDYFSLNAQVSFAKNYETKGRSVFFDVQYFNDDLRWGRITENYYKPVTVIYPAELRYKRWTDLYKRYSYNFRAGFTQIINKRNTVGIFPTFVYQVGLLATPFHRIYFSDGRKGVEQLPNKRSRFTVALRWHRFIAGNIILKNQFQIYTDDFGIKAAALENETALKINSVATLLPNIRFYTQTSSRYFAAYKQHNSQDDYFSSDYDLSKFLQTDVGIGFRYSPYKYLTKRWLFNTALLRYNFIYRSDGLHAHYFTLALQAKNSRKSD